MYRSHYLFQDWLGLSSAEDLHSVEALLCFVATRVAHVIFLRNEFFFRLVELVGDDDPGSGSVSAVHFGTGHVFAVVWVGVVIDREVDPGDRLRCRDYFDRHVWVMLGGREVVNLKDLRGVLKSSELMSGAF